MSWRIVSASVVGTSHHARGEPCQDYCVATTWHDSNGAEYLIVLVADGAGSARLGKEGAEFACQEGKRLIEEILDNLSGKCPSREEVIGWISALRAQIAVHAASAQVSIREYACTLLTAVVGPSFGVFSQIGDGGIVASCNGFLQPVLWPYTGEYANETHFLTDENGLAHLQYVAWATSSTDLALFSDGLQRLALVYESRTAHAPFFAPMLAVMHQATAASCLVLSEQLATFLASARVNERTDDDKTLVLATYHEEQHELPEIE
ncbi:Serine/threonine protein phosphatase [Gammaproteobacteria bacterium]